LVCPLHLLEEPCQSCAIMKRTIVFRKSRELTARDNWRKLLFPINPKDVEHIVFTGVSVRIIFINKAVKDAYVSKALSSGYKEYSEYGLTEIYLPS